MKRIDQDSIADLKFDLAWSAEGSVHTESYTGYGVNFWRDRFPKDLAGKLTGAEPGDVLEVDYAPGVVAPKYERKDTFRVKKAQFDRNHASAENIPEPRIGRYYPRGILKGVAGVFPQNFHPFRCVDVRNGAIDVDFNHPLARNAVRLKVTVGDVINKVSDRGGSCTDWMSLLANGPGMQVRWEGRPTDFFSDSPFQRDDEGPDDVFYQAPRMVNHVDGTAVNVVSGLYRRFLGPGMRVLDLMSSWTSHVPERLRFARMTGLGLNREELEKNERLSERVVHDLNRSPLLPFETASYDAVICSNSVEYLVEPVRIFEEAARVLGPGGCFVVTFSNRWFPPKVIRIWKELHEFERMGLVLEYFRRSGCYADLGTCSTRGLPRPREDKYASQNPYSDPVYAVWGRKA